MRALKKEFYLAHYFIPIRFLIVSAICVGAFWITGAFSRENTRVLAIVVSALMGLLTLWSLIDVLSAPKRFENQLKRYPEHVGEELRLGFESAHKLGKRWFLENYIVYFVKRRIQILRYDELRSADLKGNRLFLSLADGKAVLMPFEPDENPAVLVAALRSKNGQMKASIDGRPVDFSGKNKRKEDA